MRFGPIHRADEDARAFASRSSAAMSVRTSGRGGGGVGVHGHAGKGLLQQAELAILRPEVVAPLADAVGLVDGEEGGPETAEPLDETGHRQALRGHVQEDEPPGLQLAFDGDALGGHLAAVDVRRRHAVLAQGVDLVLHERDERRDHDGEPAEVGGGGLIADRLAAAGGQHDEGVAASEHRAHRLFLEREKVAIAPDASKRLAQGDDAVDLGLACVRFGHASMVVERRAPGNMCTIGDMISVEPFEFTPDGGPAVYGFLHRPAGPARDGIALTHGAGSDCDAPLLVALATAFAERGVTALRFDLPFRQARLRGPPSPATAVRDREGLRQAVRALRQIVPRRVFAGGHSYGGRQASIALAEDPAIAVALLLLSYPLHPPGQPGRVRAAHLPDLRVPTLFVHGTRDPFGTVAEIEAARALIPARTGLLAVESGHDLGQARGRSSPSTLAERILPAFLHLVA